MFLWWFLWFVEHELSCLFERLSFFVQFFGLLHDFFGIIFVLILHSCLNTSSCLIVNFWCHHFVLLMLVVIFDIRVYVIFYFMSLICQHFLSWFCCIFCSMCYLFLYSLFCFLEYVLCDRWKHYCRWILKWTYNRIEFKVENIWWLL